jgi:hypothetical protein
VKEAEEPLSSTTPQEKSSRNPALEKKSTDEARYSGRVGDEIPILEAEAAEPPLTRSPASPFQFPSKSPGKSNQADEPDWKKAPPPVRQPGRRSMEESEAKPAFDLVQGERKKSDQPTRADKENSVVLLGQEGEPSPGAIEGYQAESHQDTFGESRKRRQARWVMVILILSVGGILAGGAWLVWTKVVQKEEDRWQLAQEEFDQGQYIKAKKSFEQIAIDFPESPRLKEYKFMEGLSQNLQPVFEIGANKKEALEGLSHFLDDQGKESWLKPRARAIQEALDKLTEVFAEQAEQVLNPPPDVPQAKEFLQKARSAQAEGSRFRVGDNPKIQALIAKVESDIAKTQKRLDVLKTLGSLPPRTEAIEEGMKLVDRENLSQDPDAKKILDRLRETILSQVSYTASGEILPKNAIGSKDQTLPVVASLKESNDLAHAGPGVVFAVCRGVLYALTKKGGKLVWTCRVGMDSNSLPARLPAGETHPEIALVLSNNTYRLSAREALTGLERWHYDLKAPCAGKPVLVGTHTFVPTGDGTVYEIELVTGQLLGWFQLNARLSVGGTYHEGTNYLYFPAEGLQVYVLDPQRRQCVGILQTGHPAGSLHNEPLVVGGATSEPAPAGVSPRPHYLILTQTDGLGAMKLCAFAFATGSGVQTLRTEAELKIQGWTWFGPQCDGEKIALATDAGTFELFGINQVLNLDAAIFPFLPEKTHFGPLVITTPEGKSQVVKAQENDFWVLVGGELQHLQLCFDRDKGLILKKRWRQGIPLGWPLHAGQLDENRDIFVAVTQPRDQSGCLATAIEGSTGRVIWQQRLGLVGEGNPLAVGDQVLVQDAEGTLAAFNSNSKIPNGPVRHEEGTLLAGPVQNAEKTASWLLPSFDGLSVYSLVAGGGRLLVRYYQNGEIQNKAFPLGQMTAGTPGIGPDFLLIPLADGSLLWLSGDGKSRMGSWRSMKAPRNAIGHVIVLGPDTFLAADGFRGLVRWRWPPGNSPVVEKAIEASEPIVGAPLLLPDNRVGVADAGGTVSVFKTDDLQKIGQWRMPGKITAGPFALGPYLSCVVDQRRLVWMVLEEENVREYTTMAPIVGQPRLMEEGIFTSDMTGKIMVVDPATQKLRGKPYALPQGTALMGTPVPYGPNRLFVSLTDGTALSILMSQFKKEK